MSLMHDDCAWHADLPGMMPPTTPYEVCCPACGRELETDLCAGCQRVIPRVDGPLGDGDDDDAAPTIFRCGPFAHKPEEPRHYQIKSADRRDRAKLRRLRETVLAKVKTAHLNEEVENTIEEVENTILVYLWELTRVESGMEIITAYPARDFEVVEELIGYLSEHFAEEIQALHAIILTGMLRWMDRGLRAPAQWGTMMEKTFLDVWLGRRLQPEA